MLPQRRLCACVQLLLTRVARIPRQRVQLHQAPGPQSHHQARTRLPTSFARRGHAGSHGQRSDNPSEVFVVQFSPDGGMLAAGCGDGAIRVRAAHAPGHARAAVAQRHSQSHTQVFSVATGRLMYNLNIGSSANLPTTALRFRPLTSRSKTKNVLLSVSAWARPQRAPPSVAASLTHARVSADADGTVQHWHVTSGKCLHSVTEPDNQLYCVDYRSDGEMFAAAGKDYTVHGTRASGWGAHMLTAAPAWQLRLYDEATKTMVAALSGGCVLECSAYSRCWPLIAGCRRSVWADPRLAIPTACSRSSSTATTKT